MYPSGPISRRLLNQSTQPSVFGLLWQFFTTPAPEQKSVDGLIHFLGLFMGVGLLVVWIVVGIVLYKVLGKKKGQKARGKG